MLTEKEREGKKKKSERSLDVVYTSSTEGTSWAPVVARKLHYNYNIILYIVCMCVYVENRTTTREGTQHPTRQTHVLSFWISCKYYKYKRALTKSTTILYTQSGENAPNVLSTPYYFPNYFPLSLFSRFSTRSYSVHFAKKKNAAEKYIYTTLCNSCEITLAAVLHDT